MERINELLEKYFRGETTLTEENELKNYFRSNKISYEHAAYEPLFRTFDEESNESVLRQIEKIKPEQKRILSNWIQAFAYTGIAASLVLALWVQRPKQSENFAVLSGNKIQDTEYAEKYAEKKLNQVNDILNRSMKPMQKVQNIGKSIQPIHKISNIREQINEIQNKLQIK
ncbi:MAG: hypothetical protein WCK78_02080 [Paludibacter sp.]